MTRELRTHIIPTSQMGKLSLKAAFAGPSCRRLLSLSGLLWHLHSFWLPCVLHSATPGQLLPIPVLSLSSRTPAWVRVLWSHLMEPQFLCPHSFQAEFLSRGIYKPKSSAPREYLCSLSPSVAAGLFLQNANRVKSLQLTTLQ